METDQYWIHSNSTLYFNNHIILGFYVLLKKKKWGTEMYLLILKHIFRTLKKTFSSHQGIFGPLVIASNVASWYGLAKQAGWPCFAPFLWGMQQMQTGAAGDWLAVIAHAVLVCTSPRASESLALVAAFDTQKPLKRASVRPRYACHFTSLPVRAGAFHQPAMAV